MRMRIKYFLSPSRSRKMSAQAELKRVMALASRISKHWTPTIAVYAIAATSAALYVTDWKIIVTKIPYYNKKFDDEGNI